MRQVVVFGNVQVSTQAIHVLMAAEVSLSYLSGYGRFIAAVLPAPPKNVALRAAQYAAFADPQRSLALARAVVAAKIANQRTLLMRSLRSKLREELPAGSESAEPEMAVETAAPSSAAVPARPSEEPSVREMAEMHRRISSASDAGVLLGLEGQAAALYFSNFGRMLKAERRAPRSISRQGIAVRPAIR